ncbi:hypothetical protein DL764_000797 [Monosporascus ibericus]|uniref:Glycoside hydrolase 131 catalytic N-terminal domain-containing protein n=1 Tax=Monosporascus ibericus TaxID=155417 RepID=A0A4Q4TS00_9PEZI|nr:hypothetical protein DL764_000797 [Monosporascus ibericus]
MKTQSLIALLSGHLAACGTVLWDGRFNDLESATDLDEWSWSNQVGPYQWYIHGDGPTTDYVNLSPDFKNPADEASTQGVKITLDSTAYWNGQNMRRTELIPQTSAPINQGKVWYHFSIMRSDVNPPAETREHQIAFFESHFTELKSGFLGGSGTDDPLLRWMVGGTTEWSTEFLPEVWHNVAYEIDFNASTVGFWHSTGGDDLKQIVAPISASTFSNGADWHLGVLELPRDGYPDEVEDLYFSGVYVESGCITTSVTGPASCLADSSLANPTEDLDVSSPFGYRYTYRALTTRLDRRLLADMGDVFHGEVAPLRNVASVLPSMPWQIVARAQREALERNGRNALGIGGGREPLFHMNIPGPVGARMCDEAILAAGRNVIRRSEALARERELHHPYLCSREALSSYGAENKARLIEVAKKYDPTHVFRTLRRAISTFAEDLLHGSG